MSKLDELCFRCGETLTAEGCGRCGLPPQDARDELRRQKLFASYVLRDVQRSTHPMERLRYWERRVWQQEKKEAPEPAPVVEEKVPEAPAPPSTPEPLAAVKEVEPVEAPPPSVVTPPRRQPIPVEPPPPPKPASRLQRDLLNKRLEVGVWFVGVLFAVGGSLWAINIVWESLAPALRYSVLGLGLFLYAAAFITGGAMVASRYPESVAGFVLGLVGRLVGISAALPLASARHTSLGVGVVADGVFLAAMGGVLRYARRQKGAGVSDRGLMTWLLGTVLVLLAPGNLPFAAVVCTAAVALLWWSVVASQEKETPWIEDVAAAGITAAAIISSGVFADRYSPGAQTAALALAGMAAWSHVLSLGLQRRELPREQHTLVRVISLLLVTVLGLAAMATSSRDGLALLAAIIIAVAIHHADGSWLPRGLRPFGWLLASGTVAAGAATLLRELDAGARPAGALGVALGIAVLGYLAWGTLRENGDARNPGKVWSLLVLLIASLAASVSGQGEWVTVIPLLAVTRLYTLDRRAERSTLFCAAALFHPLLMVAILVTQAHNNRTEFSPPYLVAFLALVLTGAAWLLRTRKWPLLPLTSAALAWVVVVGGLSCAELVTDGQQAAASWMAAILLLIACEVSRSTFVGVVGAGMLLVPASLVGEAPSGDMGHVMVRAALSLVGLALLALLPRSRGVPHVALVVKRLEVFGRSLDARMVALCHVAAVGAAMMVLFRMATMWDRDFPLLLVSAAACATVALLFVRAPAVEVLGALVVATAVAAADLVLGGHPGFRWHHKAGLAAMATLCGWALVLAVLRATHRRLPLVTLWRRRRGRGVSAIPQVWNVVGVAGVMAAGVLVAAVMESTDSRFTNAVDVLQLSRVGLLATMPLLLLLFVSSGTHALVTAALVAGGAVVAVTVVMRLTMMMEIPTLLAAVTWLGYLLSISVVARLFYRGHRWSQAPGWLVRWPSPVFVRVVSHLGLALTAATLVALGSWLYATSTSGGAAIAQRYLQGIAIVAVLTALACYGAATRRKTPHTALLMSVCGAASITGAALSWRATGWLPPATGAGQAEAAALTVLVVLLLSRRLGRLLMFRLGLGYPRQHRRYLMDAVMVAGYALVALAWSRGVAGRPFFFELPIHVGAAVLVALLLVRPRWDSAWAAVMGAAAAAAMLAVQVARTVMGLQQDTEDALLLPALGAAMLVALLWARLLPSLAHSRVAARFHASAVSSLHRAAWHTRSSSRAVGAVAILLAALVAFGPQPLWWWSAWACWGLGILIAVRLAPAWSSRNEYISALPWVASVAVLAMPAPLLDRGPLVQGLVPANLSGMGHAVAAWAAVVGILLLQFRPGRRALTSVGLGSPARGRTRLGNLLAIALLGYVGLAFYLALAVPRVPAGMTMLVAAAATVALMVLKPGGITARVGAVGFSVVLAIVCAGLAGTVTGSAETFQVATTPAALLGVMLGCVVLQQWGARLWPWPAVSSRTRQRREDIRLANQGMLAATQVLAFVGLAGVVALSVVDDRPQGVALGCTWAALALSMVIFSRVAIDRQQTLWGAMAHGAALAIYVDLRRRTPWLDAIPGIDSLAALGMSVLFVVLRSWPQFVSRASPLARAAELYASTLPIIAAAIAPGRGSSALVLVVGGAVYAALARTRRLARYEFIGGGALVAGTIFALLYFGVDAPELYLLPVAVVGTFLARRHRSKLPGVGRYLAVCCQVPVYAMGAWSTLTQDSFLAFFLGIGASTMGLLYAYRARDRRVLYAAMASATVLVVGRLVIAGTDHPLLGTLLLVVTGVSLLAGMTLLSVKRQEAQEAWQRWKRRMEGWDDSSEG